MLRHIWESSQRLSSRVWIDTGTVPQHMRYEALWSEDGRGLTDLGSGVGQRKTPFWSNMAYLTGLGSGGVQSTAGAPLTMTALWQVHLRWSCLMFAPPLFFFPAYPPLSLPFAFSATQLPSHCPSFICFLSSSSFPLLHLHFQTPF